MLGQGGRGRRRECESVLVMIMGNSEDWSEVRRVTDLAIPVKKSRCAGQEKDEGMEERGFRGGRQRFPGLHGRAGGVVFEPRE